MSRAPILSNKDVDKAIELYNGGFSLAECAKATYASKSTIYKYFRKRGINMSRPQYSKVKRNVLMRMWNEGVSLPDIQAITGYSSVYVLKRMVTYYRKQGMPFNRYKREDEKYG